MSNLDDWKPAEPPPGFADRALAARRAELERAPAPKRSFTPAGFTAGLLMLAAIAGFFFFTRTSVATGHVVASSARSTVKLGQRALAVAQAGTALDWQISRHGDARVVQNEGDVFYRVEPGGAFVVATPAGDVTVTGTCFRVEVVPMKATKEAMVGAAVGAALSAMVLVTVYEGKVLLANEHGKTEIAAGERATSATGGAPGPALATKGGPGTPGAAGAKTAKVVVEPPPADGATREELLARDAAQRAELDKLRAQVAELEQGKQGRRGGHGGLDNDTSSFMSPTHDDLLNLAKSCTVQYDAPPIGAEPFQVSPDMATANGFTPDETARVNQALGDLNNQIVAQVRALYVDVTGNTAAAEDLTAEAMEREIEAKSGQGAVGTALKEISAERAGLVQPPANPAADSPVEQLLRLMQSVGDMAEQAIAGVVGPDRAHAMRAQNDGWGMHSRMGGGCIDGNVPSAQAPQ